MGSTSPRPLFQADRFQSWGGRRSVRRNATIFGIGWCSGGPALNRSLRLPLMSCSGVTSMGSNAAPITISLPFGPERRSARTSLSNSGPSPGSLEPRPGFAILLLRSSFCYRCRRSLQVSLRATRSQTRPRWPPPCNQICSPIERRGAPGLRCFARQQVAGNRTAVPQSVVGRNSGAEQRCCFDVA